MRAREQNRERQARGLTLKSGLDLKIERNGKKGREKDTNKQTNKQKRKKERKIERKKGKEKNREAMAKNT